MATHDDVKALNVAAVGGITTLVVFVLILALQVLYYHTDAQMEAAKEGPGAPPELIAFVSRQEALLKNGYAWADPQTKKKVLLPISRAMELTVASIQADPKAACPWGVIVAQATTTAAAKPAVNNMPIDTKTPRENSGRSGKK